MVANLKEHREMAVETGSEKSTSGLWREPSYEIWKNPERNSGALDIDDESSKVCAADSMEDPPSKLIGQFLHKQKASGDFCLDMDLEMAELQADAEVLLKMAPVLESPSVGTSESFDPKRKPEGGEDTVEISPKGGRKSRFFSKHSPENVRHVHETEEIWSKASTKGNGNMNGVPGLPPKPKNRSRLLDPPAQHVEKSAIITGSVKHSAQLRSGMLGKGGAEEEEDDPLKEEDLPEEYRKEKLDFWVLSEWVSLVVIIAALACSLVFPFLRNKNLWKLRLWKWEVLVLVLICGRLVSGWMIRVVVFLIERNFLLRKRVLYFVYGVKKAVQNCIWLGLVLIAWHYLFDKKVERETNSKTLKYVTKILVCLVVGTLIWLVKTLIVKVLASSFHVSTYFDRIQESLFNQYVIEVLSGPPLIEIKKNKEEEDRIVDEVQKLQKAGVEVPPSLNPIAFASPKGAKAAGSEALYRSPRISATGVSRVFSNKVKEEDGGISIDHLHRMNNKNVSAWNMKRLMNIIRLGALTTLDEQIKDSGYDDDDEKSTKIRSEFEAKAAARKIFHNVAKPGCRFIYLEDIMRFMQEDEALKTASLFECSSETDTKKISKSCLKNWVVNAFRERRALALTLNDTKTAVNKLHRIVNVIVGILILVVWLLILGIATTKFLLFVSSQLVVAAFIFGNTCKTVFEAIIFLFVIHPFDVGDRCEIDEVQMVVEEMNILTTVFLRYDNQKITIANSVLATKAIGNYYRSPDMGDGIEFLIHIATPTEKIALMRQRIISYIEKKDEHWQPSPMVIFKELEDLKTVRIAVWLAHRMNHQDIGEKWSRRGLLIEEMVKIFKELDMQYRLLPLDVNVHSFASMPLDRLPPAWTG